MDKKTINLGKSRYGDERILVEKEHNIWSTSGFKNVAYIRISPSETEGEFNFIDFDGGPFIAKDSIIDYENNQLIVKKIVFLDNRYHIVTDVVENNKGE